MDGVTEKNVSMTQVERLCHDLCPKCGNDLDTGWECNTCGYDAIGDVRRIGVVGSGRETCPPYPNHAKAVSQGADHRVCFACGYATWRISAETGKVLFCEVCNARYEARDFRLERDEAREIAARLLLNRDQSGPRLRHALDLMSQVNQWLGQHDGHVEAVKLGQAMRDVRWVLVGLDGGAVDDETPVNATR